MNHRMIITALVMGFGALMVSSFSISQPEGRPMPPNGGPSVTGANGERIKERINLTDEQEGKIQRIFEAQNKEMKELFESEMKARDAKREEMKRNVMRCARRLKNSGRILMRRSQLF